MYNYSAQKQIVEAEKQGKNSYLLNKARSGLYFPPVSVKLIRLFCNVSSINCTKGERK